MHADTHCQPGPRNDNLQSIAGTAETLSVYKSLSWHIYLESMLTRTEDKYKLAGPLTNGVCDPGHEQLEH